MTSVQSPSTPGVLLGDTFVDLETINDRATRAASALASLEVGQGDTIALLLRNDTPFFEASFAAALLGAAPVPINWHGRVDEIMFVIEDSRAKILVVHSDLLEPIRSALPADLPVRVVPTPDVLLAKDLPETPHLRADDVQWRPWVEAHPPLANAGPAEPFSMIYTSGTTGRPKGVRRLPPPGRSAPTPGRGAGANFLGLVPGMRTVVTGPTYHTAPNAYALAAARLGGLVVLQPRFDAEELLTLVEKHRITHLHMVPTMFVRLLRLPEEIREKYDVSSLMHVVHAAAPCPPAVKRAMIDWFGPIIHEYYGGTETGAVTACTTPEWLSHPGTVGSPLPDTLIKILDSEGRALEPGEIGEVYMRNHAFPDFTYEGNPDARRDVERDGLITCGDIGYLDDDGFLFLCDRARDMIISGGVNVYPSEIEACIIEMNGVRDCAVFGAPDEEYGEKIVAAIEVDEGVELDAQAVQAHVAARLAKFKAPCIVTFHDSLPREDSGKIFKRRLRAPYWEGAGRSI